MGEQLKTLKIFVYFIKYDSYKIYFLSFAELATETHYKCSWHVSDHIDSIDIGGSQVDAASR